MEVVRVLRSTAWVNIGRRLLYLESSQEVIFSPTNAFAIPLILINSVALINQSALLSTELLH